MTALETLKCYTHGKKNTDKVEISVLELNRIIKALEQEPIDCTNAEHDADGCLGYSTDRGGYSYCQTCLECPKASINNRDKEQEPCDDTRPYYSNEWTPEDSLYVEQGMLYD